MIYRTLCKISRKLMAAAGPFKTGRISKNRQNNQHRPGMLIDWYCLTLPDCRLANVFQSLLIQFIMLVNQRYWLTL